MALVWLNALAIALVIAGAAMEAWGFLLVLDDLRAAEQIVEGQGRDQVVRPMPARGQARAYGVLVDVSGPAPTIERRVVGLEQRVAALSEQLDDARAELRSEINAAVDEAVQQAGNVAADDVRRLAAVVAGVSVGGHRRDAIRLFVLGLALAALGNIQSLA